MDGSRNPFEPTSSLVLEIDLGTIMLWSGSIASIPTGWTLCDGTLGTPDLRGRFVFGAGSGVDPDDTGGSTIHGHDFTGDGHFHTIPTDTLISDTVDQLAASTEFTTALGRSDNTTGIPPFYSLAYIMFKDI